MQRLSVTRAALKKRAAREHRKRYEIEVEIGSPIYRLLEGKDMAASYIKSLLEKQAEKEGV